MSLKPRNVDFQETWSKLRDTVSTVVSLRTVERSVWNARFSDVYALCVAHPEPLAGRLYDETRHFLEQHVSGLLEKIKGDLDLESDDYLDGLLQRYVSLWKEYSQGVSYLNALYSYLNLQHVKRQKVSEAEIIYGTAAAVTAGQDSRQLEIGELGLWWWECGVVRPLQRALSGRLGAALAAARAQPLDGRAADVVRAAVHSTVAVQSYRVRRPLSLYEEVVLNPFLSRAAECHARTAAHLLGEGDVSHYMEHVLDGLSREQSLCARYLDPSSAMAVRVCYERAAVEAHLTELHNSCDMLVKRASEDGPDSEQRRLDASRLFALVRPLGAEALRPLVDAAHRQALKHGRTLLEAEHPAGEAHTHFVSCMLQLHDKYSALFSSVFGGCQVFMGALDKACSEVVNSQQPCRAPELLARYCDAILRRRAAPEPEAESGLARAIVVFKYLDDKDVFQKYYARALAKRLIHQLTASMELEETMINRLKAACGYEFTNKLHRMFTDVTLSTELNAKFQRYLTDKPAATQSEGSPLSVLVLQAGAWPLGGGGGGGAGAGGGGALLNAAKHFEAFYRGSFSGRRLSWLWALSAGELRGRLSKDLLIHASALQCALLLLYQNTDVVSSSEAMAQLGLEGEQWKRQVVPLITAGLLLGEPEGDLTLNVSLAPRRARLRIAPLPSAAADGQGGAREQTVCDDDRKMYLQAALVRIMKQRKVLRHTELVSEVVSQARGSFAPSVGMIKKCIEALIDKQYIERAPGRLDTYSYLA